jgi:hypothetical protein
MFDCFFSGEAAGVVLKNSDLQETIKYKGKLQFKNDEKVKATTMH